MADPEDRKQERRENDGEKARDQRPVGREASDVIESDLAADKMGRNSLQGDDQEQVRNQRQAVPDVKREADEDPIDTMEKTDKDVRAKRDLGKRK